MLHRTPDPTMSGFGVILSHLVNFEKRSRSPNLEALSSSTVATKSSLDVVMYQNSSLSSNRRKTWSMKDTRPLPLGKEGPVPGVSEDTLLGNSEDVDDEARLGNISPRPSDVNNTQTNDKVIVVYCSVHSSKISMNEKLKPATRAKATTYFRNSLRNRLMISIV